MLLAQNLIALERFSPDAARVLRKSKIREGIRAEISREGSPYIVADRGPEGEIALASRIDPAREGAKLASAHSSACFLACAGLGSLYHIRAALRNGSLERLLVVETDPGLCAAVFSLLDARDIFADRRFSLALADRDNDPRHFSESAIASEYVPALYGSFGAMRSRGASTDDESRYDAIMEGFSIAADSAVSDFKVQSSFGYAWFKNSSRNLWMLAEGQARLDPPVSKRVAAIASGPSLEEQLPRLSGVPLIACDSSLAYIEHQGVLPYAAISIDCQSYVYHHYLPLARRDMPSILDLASPPCVARGLRKPLFIASAHPFARLTASRLGILESLDYPGGTVTGAAISLATRLGAEEIYLAGADFSYPRGRLYARGLYIHNLFAISQRREKPLESLAFAFARRDPSAKSVPSKDGFVIRVSGLDGFRASIESFAKRSGFAVNTGIKGELRFENDTASLRPIPLISGGADKALVRKFVASVIEALRAIDPLSAYDSFHDDRKPFLLSALPLAAWALRKNQGDKGEALKLALKVMVHELEICE